jgi:hypothetical protein
MTKPYRIDFEPIDSCSPALCLKCRDLAICVSPKVERLIRESNDTAAATGSVGWRDMQRAVAESAASIRALPPVAKCDSAKCAECDGADFCYRVVKPVDYPDAMRILLRSLGVDEKYIERV